MAYNSGHAAPVDMAFSQGESPRCYLPFEWDAVACSDAEWLSYPNVQP